MARLSRSVRPDWWLQAWLVLLPVGASACAEDVVLGEHVAAQTSLPAVSSTLSTANVSEPATSSHDDSSARDPMGPHTHDYRPDIRPDGGRFLVPREAGPRRPPWSGEPGFPEPRPLPSNPDFQLESPNDEWTHERSGF